MVPRDKGFTLLEVLLVFVILGVILSMAAPSLSSTIDTVGGIGLEADVQRIEAAVQLYYLDTQVFPRKLEDLWQRPDEGSKWKGPYFNPDTLILPKGDYLIGNRGNVSIIK